MLVEHAPIVVAGNYAQTHIAEEHILGSFLFHGVAGKMMLVCHCHIVLMKKLIVKILTRGATLNPQNRVVCSALHQMGYKEIATIRVERCCLVELRDGADSNECKKRMEEGLKGNKFSTIFNPITDVFEIEEVP